MFKKNKKQILICDFSASLKYTHHLQYIRSNIMFINRNYRSVFIGVILPIASEISSDELKPADFTRKLLLPIFHFPHTKISSSFTWITFFWRKLGQLISKINPRIYLNLSVFFVTPYFIFNRANLIVFPSVCAQSLKLIEILEFFHVKKSIHIHFTNTSEIRNPYSTIKNCEKFISKSNEFQSVDIVISFEAQTLLDSYSWLNYKNNFYLAHPPSTSNSLSSTPRSLFFGKTDDINILVMGRVTDPGRDSLIFKSLREFQNMFRKIDKLKECQFKFSITANDYSQFGGPRNFNSFEIIQLGNKINYLDLINLLNTATVIVLPYNPFIYNKNNSGMLLISSDLQIPIITCEQAVFSDEVHNYKLGKLFDYEKSFAEALIHALVNISTFDFKGFYDYREQQNQEVFRYLNFTS